MLDDLKKKNVKATFFMNGHSYKKHCIYDYAHIVKRAYDEGHQIASHTWSHPYLTLSSEEEIIYQIEKLETAFRKIIGAIPTYFRPPFGAQNVTVRKILRDKGYKIVLWDVNTRDYEDDLKVSTHIFDKIERKSPQPNPHIVLNHDRVETTSTTLGPYEASEALRRGYKVTTVGDCTGKPDKNDWYRDISEPQSRDDTWVCTPEDMHLPKSRSPQLSQAEALSPLQE